MEKKDLKDKVLTNLRSVTQSCKGGVPLFRLNRDYQDLLGSPIPFKELGYSSLESFIRSIPNVISLNNVNGQLVAEGVADNTTAHIVSLVSRQKESKTLARPGRKPTKRGGFSSRYSSRGNYHSSRPSYPPPVKAKFPPDSSHSKYPPPKSKAPYFTSARSSASVSSASGSSSKPYRAPASKYELPPRFQKLQVNGNQKNASYSSRQSPEIEIPRPKSPLIEEVPIPSPKPRTVTYNSKPAVNTGNWNSFDQDSDSAAPQRNPRPLRPVVDKRQDKFKALQNIENPIEYVQMYAEINELGEPIYQNQLMGQKKHNKGYTSVLKLNGKSYLSYPEIVKTEAEAKLIAAQKAVESIKESEEFLTGLPATPLTTEEEVQIFLKNIEEIVVEKPTGIFSHGVKHEYETKFEKTLPDNWIEKVKESSLLDVEQVTVSYGRVPDGKSYIIRPTKNYSSGSTTPSEVSSSVSLNHSDIAMKRFEQPPPPKVPELTVPDGNEWPVYITYASTYIAARLIDFDEEYVDFMKSMSEFYSSHSLPISEVIEKHMYALVDDASDGVLRVLVNKVMGSEVECYYVDDGYYDKIPKSYLQELHKDFLKFPFQAVLLAADGLESYEPFMNSSHYEFLKERTLIAVVKRFRNLEEELLLPKFQGIHKRVFSVELYDTSEEEDLCLNEELKQSALSSWECSLPEEGVIVDGYMTHFDENGDVYVRFLDPCNSLLEIELDKLSGEFEEAAATCPDVSSHEIFAAKFIDGRWYRAVLADNSSTSDPELMTVFFIDYGHPSVVKKSEISPLWQHSEFLASLGKQVIQCSLQKALPPHYKWTDKAFAKLMELAPSDIQLFVRVVREGSNFVLPEVTLLKRQSSDPNSPIISINEELFNSPHLFELDLDSSNPLNVPSNLRLFHSNNELLSDSYANSASGVVNFPKLNDGIEWLTTPDIVKSPDAFDVVTPSPLRPPQVPDENDMFDVFVTIAATPHNFIVQPLGSASDMSKLRVEMQTFYSTEENLIEMDPTMLRRNCFYAALNPDGEWYRVRVVAIQENKDNVTAAVYYVDFGDFGNISIQNLQLLGQSFRALPCQAIKASLAGIKPIVGRDWNPIHCVKFKEMITEKNFVSIVKSKCLVEEQDFGCLELELVLVDTTDPIKDVIINDVLVEKSMARRV